MTLPYVKLDDFLLLSITLVLLFAGVASNIYFALRGVAERQVMLQATAANGVLLEKIWARMAARGRRREDELKLAQIAKRPV